MPFPTPARGVSKLIRRLAWCVCALAAGGSAFAQASCGGFVLSVKPGPVLFVTGPTDATNDYRIEFADTLEAGQPWRTLTNFPVLPESPCAFTDPDSGSGSQRYYRLRIATNVLPGLHERSVTPGGSVRLSGSIDSACPSARYQWQRNGTNLVDGEHLQGSTESALWISGAEAGDAGLYRLAAITGTGPVLSGPVLLIVQDEDTDTPYGTASWPASLGNHRARVAVTNRAAAVWVRLPWRRRDPHPEWRDLQVFDSSTGLRVTNVFRVQMNQEFGDVLFEPPTAPGEYEIYYLPYVYEGWEYGPKTIYLPPTQTAGAAWAVDCASLARDILAGETNGIPAARVLAFQSITSFDRPDPMELIATSAEKDALLAANAGPAFLLFPEDRKFPIRMTENLPWRWIKRGITNSFSASASRGEFFAFQIGLYAAGQALQRLNLEFADLAGDDGTTIPASALRCFNLAGTNGSGVAFSKAVDVPQGRVQPLWIGVDIGKDAKPQTYHGQLRVGAANAPAQPLSLTLAVTEDSLSDAGDSQTWRHSRLRWLDSTLGLDDEVCPPFAPIAETNLTVAVLGRQAHIGQGGLFDQIQSTFSRSVDSAQSAPRNLLSGPMRMVIVAGGIPLAIPLEVPSVVYRSPGALAWAATNSSAEFQMRCHGRMECDGYVNFQVTVKSVVATNVNDVRLELPIDRRIATYLMGLGHRGGLRPPQWDWHWSADANNAVWLGEVNAGLCLKLKDTEDRWDQCWLPGGGYRDWSNEGKGGCTISDVDSNTVVLRAYTGPRAVAPGEELHFNFGLLITPAKPLNPARWDWRHYQAAFEPDPPVSNIISRGATIVNIHSGQALNPYINYPFLTTDALGSFIGEAHAQGLKVKPYYTLRELSNHATELWALRSLGNEILADGSGGIDAESTGTSWLCEHLVAGYSPTWQHPLGGGQYDAALLASGRSRWMNYYLEGLNWLAANLGIDGIYLDGIGYDREFLKRLRKVLLRARPGALIDFHSGDNFGRCGNLSSACQYAEHLPYVDSLWFGEFFDPDSPPEYWLVEMSGIPFGLSGEMLESCGNPWRGMLFGMSTRFWMKCDPQSMWKLWDEFGISGSRMVGYWDEACPVRTDHSGVLATAYIRPERTLIALASWAPQTVDVRLLLDSGALGVDLQNAHLRAPAIEGLQPARVFQPTDPIPVAPSGGWLLILEPSTGSGY